MKEEAKTVALVDEVTMKRATDLTLDEKKALPRFAVKFERTVGKKSRNEFFTATILLYSGTRTAEELMKLSEADKKVAQQASSLVVAIKINGFKTLQDFQTVCLATNQPLDRNVHIINCPVRLSKGIGEKSGRIYAMYEAWLPGLFFKDFIPDLTLNFIKLVEKHDPRILREDYVLKFVDRKFTAAEEEQYEFSGDAE